MGEYNCPNTTFVPFVKASMTYATYLFTSNCYLQRGVQVREITIISSCFAGERTST